MTTFIDMIRDGIAGPDQIDDWIDAWHGSSANAELHDTLGMTLVQYQRWVMNPGQIDAILEEHGITTGIAASNVVGLAVTDRVTGQTQETKFMNACMTTHDNVSISIAATTPKAYHTLSALAFNEALSRDLMPLIALGWNFEIKRGNDKANAETRQRFVNAIENH